MPRNRMHEVNAFHMNQTMLLSAIDYALSESDDVLRTMLDVEKYMLPNNLAKEFNSYIEKHGIIAAGIFLARVSGFLDHPASKYPHLKKHLGVE